MNHRIGFVLAIGLFALLPSSGIVLLSTGTVRAAPPPTLDFADQIQPILRRHCYRCHGSKNQDAGLQLNARAAALGVADSDQPIITAGDPENSLLLQRLVDEDYGDIMPLDGDPLAAAEIDILRRWIAEGASWPDEYADATHWAYRPITRPTVPDVGLEGHDHWGQLPIDRFVMQRLVKRGLRPSPPVDRARLLRRVSLALTGISPTPQELDQFLNDTSPGAYENVVDRLLKSNRYGERWAVSWLDLARYADSNGYQADQIRDNWAYRDWVIRAFNGDMPFDRFVVEQIAGDLLPKSTVDQKVATGFHRMTTCNVEAGVHPEANRVDQIVDRVNTTATVFLGTTMECAQCHDHKYDPFTQTDYYQFFAYFNNTPLEVKNTSGVTWDFYGPTMDLPMSDSLQRKYDDLQLQVAGLKDRRNETLASSDAAFDAWLERLRDLDGETLKWRSIRPEAFETTGGEDFAILEDGAVLLSGTVPDVVEHVFTLAPDLDQVTAIKIDALTDETIDGKGPGRGDAKRTNIILSELIVERFGDKERETLQLENPKADFSQTNWPVAAAIDGDRKTGWAISPQFGKPHWASFSLSSPATLRPGVDKLRVTLGQFYGRGRVLGKPRVSVYSGDPSLLDIDADVIALAKKTSHSEKQRERLRQEFNDNDPRLTSIDRKIARLEREAKQLKPDSTLVMVELDQPRETFVLLRGDYERPSEKVEPGFPAILPKSPSVPPTGDRLELARLLTARENPLLARVTVNRWWAELFGAGLVGTPEDFGTQADDPSHPRLLDWLAIELIDSQWSMKHVHKQIVMSQTFRQSARRTDQLSEVDPDNRLLARGPRFRIPAELIRDNALAIGGILSSKMYGPPVMPYQPADLWRSVGRNQPKWVVAENEDRFRPGVYVIWKRAAPYPSFINFDAPDRGSCSVSRSRSNTPLQALTLLNDPAYAEIALAFADRVLSQCDDQSDDARLRFAFKIAISRSPTAREIDILRQLLRDERQTLAADTTLAAQRTKRPYAGLTIKSNDVPELAAWFAVTNALLNLDETMTQ
jgi:hypothetical protein